MFYGGRFFSLRILGFAYLAVLALMMATSLSLAVVSQHEEMQQRRQKELDWLFAGKQYQAAITRYYQQSPQGKKTLPSHLQDLLLDNRFVGTVRHLRKLYLDPFSGQPWLLVVDAEGKLIGVKSASQQPILLRQALAEIDAEGDQTQVHSDVVFAFKLPVMPANAPNSLPAQEMQPSMDTDVR